MVESCNKIILTKKMVAINCEGRDHDGGLNEGDSNINVNHVLLLLTMFFDC